jgi:polyisoprenoid-binding protein YceI
MKNVSLLVAAALTTVFFAFKPIETTTWTSDSVHSRVGFSVVHLGISNLNGSFNTYEAKLTVNNPDLSDAVVEFSGDAASINTNNEMRDKHLKSPDFFDAEKYPKFNFKSTSFKKKEKDEYTVQGQLTLHGVTKEITLIAKYNGTATNPQSQKQINGFHVTGTFKRSDFGVGASIPAMMVSDEVNLVADLELVKN